MPSVGAVFFATYFFVSMMLGRLLFAVLHFKRSAPFLLSMSLILTALAILGGVYGHPILLALSGFTIAPFYPLAISWISSEFPEDLDTAVTYMMGTDSFMLIVMHLSVGKLTDLFSIHYAVLLALVFVMLSLVMVNSYRLVFRDRVVKPGHSKSK